MDVDLMPLRRSFVMAALAMLSHQKELLLRVIVAFPEFTVEPMPKETALRLAYEVRNGNVTSIVPKPGETFSFICCRGSFGSLRTVFGVWLERPASWRGQESKADAESIAFGELLVAEQKQFDETLRGKPYE